MNFAINRCHWLQLMNLTSRRPSVCLNDILTIPYGLGVCIRSYVSKSREIPLNNQHNSFYFSINPNLCCWLQINIQRRFVGIVDLTWIRFRNLILSKSFQRQNHYSYNQQKWFIYALNPNQYRRVCRWEITIQLRFRKLYIGFLHRLFHSLTIQSGPDFIFIDIMIWCVYFVLSGAVYGI